MSAATDALLAYGFVPDGKGLVKTNPATGQQRTRYETVEGGFHRFEREDGGWRQYPYTIHPDWEGVGGLAFDEKQARGQLSAKVKPECFEWVYPAAFVEGTYGAAEG